MIARRPSIVLFASVLIAASFFPAASRAAEKRVKSPTMEELGDGKGTRRLLLPEDISTFLQKEFPNSRLPAEEDFSPEMRQYYFSRLVGVHPAVAWGDFNGDKKRDYLFLVITGDTKWGPLCELVAVNGGKKGYEAFRLGEVYNFKEDYVSFQDNKLSKGRYRKGAWYINWDPKKSLYIVTKS
jgi:hypothetical protein